MKALILVAVVMVALTHCSPRLGPRDDGYDESEMNKLRSKLPNCAVLKTYCTRSQVVCNECEVFCLYSGTWPIIVNVAGSRESCTLEP